MTPILRDLPDARAADRWGEALAGLLRTGDLVMLSGDLGMGKSTLARGIIRGFCGEPDAPSPTYVLAISYAAPDGTPLTHADLYRLEDPAELDELGLEEAAETGVLIVEWPERAGFDAGQDALRLLLSPAQGEGRRLEIIPSGRWETLRDRLERLA
jgi:tRNA threonylcarbamoyl adenosine modification protein YjeE